MRLAARRTMPLVAPRRSSELRATDAATAPAPVNLTRHTLIRLTRATAAAWLRDTIPDERAHEFQLHLEAIKTKTASLVRGAQQKTSRKSSPSGAKENFAELILLLNQLKAVGDFYVPLKVRSFPSSSDRIIPSPSLCVPQNATADKACPWHPKRTMNERTNERTNEWQVLDATNAFAIISDLEARHPNAFVVTLCNQIKTQWQMLMRKHLVVATSTWNPVSESKKNLKGLSNLKGTGGAGRDGKAVQKDSRVHNSPSVISPRKRMRSPVLYPKVNANGRTSAGIGKGRKICHHCNQIVGSPSRICPFCKGALPLKTPKS